MPKPFASPREELAWGFSSRARKPVWGLSVVLLIWPNGPRRLPLGFRLWHPGGPSQYELAVELLSDARNRWCCRPAYGLFEAWYPVQKLRKRIRDYGWSFVCRIKKNRRFKGKAVRHYRRHPYWAEIGWLNGGSKVLVVRHGKKSSATHRLTLTAPEACRQYRFRSHIAEGSRFCKDQRGLTGCQARSRVAQEHHLTCCLLAVCVRARERHDRGLSIYKLKRRLRYRGRSFSLPALELLREAA